MTAWILSSCALIAAIMLLRRLLRGRMDPRLTYALWLLAALRVLIPTSLFTAPVSVSGLAERSGVTEAVEAVREAVTPKQTFVGSLPENSGVTLDEYADSFSSSGIHIYHVTPFTDAELSELRKENPAFYANTDSQPLRITAELIIGNFTFWRWVYAAGATVVFLILLRCNVKFYARLKRSRRPCEEELPVPCPLPVYVASGLPSPCLFGLIRPAVYLNDAALRSGHLDHILVHELTHRRHFDHWWALVRCACLAVQWFNPLVWIAARMSRQDCETACDASAIRRLGEPERLSYGRTLVGMIAAGSRRPSALLETATTMTGSVSSIRERVTLIARKPRMTAVTLVSVLLIAALAAGCTFGGAAPSGAPDEPRNSDTPGQEPSQTGAAPAEQAESLYAAIVGAGVPLNFTMEVDDGGVTRVDVSGDAEGGSWHTDFAGNCLSGFDWQAAFSDRTPSGASLTMTSADGQTWLRCWSDSDLVLLHQDGTDSWMTAAPPSGPGSSQTVYQTLLRTAGTVLRQQAFDIAVPESAAASGPTEAGVLLAYTRQLAENLKALPDWVQGKPLDAAVKSVTVTQSYFGGSCPNFCSVYSLYLDVGDPMSARASEWQAGAGLDTETEGDYAGWSVWYIGSNFYYDAQSRVYRCSGRYTGGEELTFPHSLDEATLAELLDDLNFTSSGNDHDNRIPRRIFERFSLSELNAALLAYHPDEPWRANTIAKSLGSFLSRETGSDVPSYDAVYAALDESFRPFLEQGTKETPPDPVTFYAADYS